MDNQKRDPSQFEDELKELKNALPIKHGGLKLLGKAFLDAGILFSLIWSTYHLIFLDANGNCPLDYLAGGFIIIFLCSALIYGLTEIGRNTGNLPRKNAGWISQFKTYFQRNVRGNTALIALVNDQSNIRVFVWNSVEKPELPDSNIAILVPLGGWFNQPKSIGILGADRWWKRPLKVRIDGIPGSYPLNLKMQDPNGSKIRHINALTFLQILDNSSNFEDEYPHCWGFSIDQLVFALNSKKASLQSKLDQIKSTCTELNERHALALNALFDESQALKDTSRVGKSTEGKAIRERMEATLLELLPEDDARRQLLKPKAETP